MEDEEEKGLPGGEEVLTIPPPLVPVLALLRDHITNLTRDNEALRYTFLGSSRTSTSTSTSTSISPNPSEPIENHRLSKIAVGGSAEVDLREVLKRVKELVRENEELGEMVLEAGRNRKEDWQRSLDRESH